MKKTIARTLMILGMLSGLGATTNVVEQEQRDFRDIFGPRQTTEEAARVSGPSQDTGFFVGTALEFAMSGGLLGAAAAVNGRASQGVRLDSDRPINLELKQKPDRWSVIQAFNSSNR